MADIFLISRGTGGDIYPFMQIGKQLKERGHEITLVTHFEYKSLVSQAGFRFAGLDFLVQSIVTKEDLESITPEPSAIADEVHRARNDIRVLIEHCRSPQTVFVAHYNSLPFVEMAGEKLRVPVIAVLPSPGFIAAMQDYDELCNRLYNREFNQVRAELGLTTVQDWNVRPRAVKRIVGFWPKWFAIPDPVWSLEVTPLGFVQNDDLEAHELPVEAQEFLDRGAPPVLFTHGTSRPDVQYFNVIVEACEFLNIRGILVTRDSDLIPRRLPPEVRWFPHLPFATLIPRVKAVVHHGGIGTCARALAAGVPQLLLPAAWDQPYNAGRLHKLGVAEFLLPNQWNADTIAGSLNRLLTSETVQKHSKYLALLTRGINAASAMCDIVEESVGAVCRTA